ncbi:HAD hydrolase family protein [Butyrivibrio sp. AC2005]|uniref:HAD hydrolase family protein n=1 Tax=Butyrivibrio sp. AC2005 TaxID=1280672 RepID=UPI00041A5C5E|nr:HAD hydrolase family protein [Butyrivibrio sp. AC2005]
MRSYFVDLDGTLIFSYRHYHDGYKPIEIYNNKEISFIEHNTYSKLILKITDGSFVPVTSRTKAQYERIDVFKQYHPSYALLDNGGILLVNGEEDFLWKEETLEIIKASAKGLKEIEQWAGKIAPTKVQDGLVLFIKPEDETIREKIIKKMESYPEVYWFDHGKKLYICPRNLTKGNSIRRLKEKLGVDWCVGAGDSEVDFSMIDQVDMFVTDKNNREKIQDANVVFVEAKDIALTVLNLK